MFLLLALYLAKRHGVEFSHQIQVPESLAMRMNKRVFGRWSAGRYVNTVVASVVHKFGQYPPSMYLSMTPSRSMTVEAPPLIEKTNTLQARMQTFLSV